MAKKKEITPEVLEKREKARKKDVLDGELKDILYKKSKGILPLNPTRHFVVGDRVVLGNLGETYVREVFEDGLYYLIESLNVKRERNKPAENESRLIEWHEIYLYNSFKSTNFRKPEEHFLSFFNSGLQSLLVMVYHAGVDFNVDYQRDHVWTLDDKIALIDSIFNNIDIGKFVFVQRSFSHDDKLYEILDGKQRLTALCEFYEDRFQYNGFYYSELSYSDKNKFGNHGIAYGYLENPTRKAIFETFIKLNTCGRPMENKDIQKVKKLLDELK